METIVFKVNERSNEKQESIRKRIKNKKEKIIQIE